MGGERATCWQENVSGEKETGKKRNKPKAGCGLGLLGSLVC
jgi:hypothetical protein